MAKKYTLRLSDGITEISRPTSSTVILRIPYSRLSNNIHTNNSFIVYILYGRCDTGKDKIYVGKSKNGIDQRPTSHEDKYDNWEFCYVLTQHKENTFFNDGIIQYIENQISNHINELGSYDNTTVTTTDSTVNDYEKDDCKAYIDEAYSMLYAMGLDLITEHKKAKTIVKDEVIKKEKHMEPVKTEIDPKYETFYLKRNMRNAGIEVKATMQIVNGKYVVKAGAILNPIIDNKYPEIARRRKEVSIVNNILQEDIAIESLSGASCFVVGGASNGWTEWKDQQGVTIDELKR